MKKFIEYVSHTLVSNSENVVLNERIIEEKRSIELQLPRVEMGKVIGKHGQMADALRTITSFYGKKILKKPVSFHIVEK